ncbi:hypothetical protein KSP35_17160 [Aquihabitans sp. G128]|uniref:hypothetical protein n=1 Tax=Aquihabitans sp. G128 TaxID=2849779 RepID=UPI001C229504|nr:hypothetical protein [Aquihabitans sp. G128]QXC60077.1 hypothetical protein KSP35_17160 [Aquihabitans sp. G128]
MTFRKLAIAAVALCLPFAAAACGGSDDTNSGSRPATSEISKAITKELPSSLPDGVADCIAKKVHDSDIPNGVLRAIVKGETASVDKDNEATYTKILTDAATSCASAAVGGS